MSFHQGDIRQQKTLQQPCKGKDELITMALSTKVRFFYWMDALTYDLVGAICNCFCMIFGVVDVVLLCCD
jgi:hypothetical protein